MGKELILQPQAFHSHVEFLSGDGLTAKNINTYSVSATHLAATSYVGGSFSSGVTSVSAVFRGAFYGWGWDLDGVDKSQPAINTWVRANTAVATAYTTLSAKNVYGDYFGIPLFRTVSGSEISTNVALGSSTFHGIFYGDGRRLLGSAFDQDVINTWVRANTAVATGFTTLSAKNVHGDFVGTPLFKELSANVISTNTALGSSTFHGVYYGNGWELDGVDKSQPTVNTRVRELTALNNPGLTWSAVNIPNNSWSSITYGNGVFVAIATNSNQVAISPDGVNWSASTGAGNNAWNSVTFGNGLFVAVAVNGPSSDPTSNNRVMTSVDGRTWTLRAASSANTWYAVSYGNGLFVVVSLGGQIMYSNNGVNWTNAVLPVGVDNPWSSITYGNGVFVVVASNGPTSNPASLDRVLVSSDGVTWSVQQASAPNAWTSVTYGNGVFVAVSQDGTGNNRVMTSTNGSSWVTRNAINSNSWYSVTYGGSLFIAVSFDGTGRIMASYDGISWVNRPAITGDWDSIAYGNGVFVIIAGSGTPRAISSGRQITPEVISNIRHGDSTLFGNYTVSGSISASLSAGSSTSFVVENGGLLQKRFLELSIIPQFTFTKDLSVSLGGGKTFGRYINGDIISSTGKTVPQVLEMSLIEPIPPDITLGVSPTTYSFATTAISTTLTVTWKLCSLGATLSSAFLKYRRLTTDPWTNLRVVDAPTVTLTSYSFTHVFNDPLVFSGATNAAGTDWKPYNYQLEVGDSAGAFRVSNSTVNIQNYSAPTWTFSSPTTVNRERGDTSSAVSFTLNRGSGNNVPITSYQLQRVSTGTGGSTTNITGIVPVTTTANSTAISFFDNDSAIPNVNTITYRVQVGDAYKNYAASGATTQLNAGQTVNLVHRSAFFYAPNATTTLSQITGITIAPTTSPGAILVNPESKSRIINSVLTPATDYVFWIYPASLGNVTTIMQNINFDVGGSFANSQADITGVNSYGATVTYRVYRSNAQGAFQTTPAVSLTFS